MEARREAACIVDFYTRSCGGIISSAVGLIISSCEEAGLDRGHILSDQIAGSVEAITHKEGGEKQGHHGESVLQPSVRGPCGGSIMIPLAVGELS